jgi:hypothetical protein
MQARIKQLDTASTKANAIGGQVSGYDRIFREPVRSSAGADSRVYSSEYALPCQVISERGGYDKLAQLPGGRELEFDLRTALHYADLEAAGLCTANGSTSFKPGDRLCSIYRADGTTKLRDFDANPLYLVHVQDRSFGLDGLTRNLVLLYWEDRREGAP